MRRSMLSILLLLIASVAFAGEKPKIAATIGRTVITDDDVNREIGNRLMKLRTDEYNIRRGAVETIIEDRLLAAEAARRGISVDALLQAEVESKVQTPSTADIEPFYEASKDRYGAMSAEDAMQHIAASMRQQKASRRRAEFIASLRDAAGVKVLLEPPRAAVEASGPARGRAGAPVTIVEFSDFECSACGRAAPTVKKIAESYGDKVRVVYRDFPLQGHRGARRAAEAAHCAGEQDKFWPMHDKLFSKGGTSVSEGDINRYAAELGLDGEKFAACLDSGRHAETWKASLAEGTRIGVVSTPTFFINGRMVAGAAPYDYFARVIDEELARAGGGGGRSVTASP